MALIVDMVDNWDERADISDGTNVPVGESGRSGMVICSPAPLTVPMLFGDSGEVVGEVTKDGFRECWMPPFTIDAWRLCACG